MEFLSHPLFKNWHLVSFYKFQNFDLSGF